jgi:hypothetical protein
MGSVMFETGFVQLRGPIKGRCPSIQLKGALEFVIAGAGLISIEGFSASRV